jgi:hypothetical protein
MDSTTKPPYRGMVRWSRAKVYILWMSRLRERDTWLYRFRVAPRISFPIPVGVAEKTI